MSESLGPKNNDALSGKTGRHKRVRELIARCMSRGDIAAALQDEYGISRSVAYSDVKAVYLALANENEEERPLRKDKIRRSLEKLYERALDSNQLAVALNVLKELASIDGLVEAQRVKIEQLYKLEVQEMDGETLKKEMDEVMAAMGVKA